MVNTEYDAQKIQVVYRKAGFSIKEPCLKSSRPRVQPPHIKTEVGRSIKNTSSKVKILCNAPSN